MYSMKNFVHGEIEKITYLDQFFSDQRFQSVTSHKGHAKKLS